MVNEGRTIENLWFEPLLGCCREAHVPVRPPYPVEVVLFYVARWCQKTTADDVPDIASLEGPGIQRSAERIVRNLVHDGRAIDDLVAGSPPEWTALRRLLMKSAGPRGGQRADDYVDEALQKIAVVLLTGTPPSRAVQRLEEGPAGPRNEYIFTSPFSYWARTIVINLIVDDGRRERRERERARDLVGGTEGDETVAAIDLEKARKSLSDLLDAIGGLPPAQRSVMVASLCRTDVGDEVVDLFCELSPDLFPTTTKRHESDDDIARALGSTSRRVAANRSVARARLVEMDAQWSELLDRLLPHKSTRSRGPAQTPPPREHR